MYLEILKTFEFPASGFNRLRPQWRTGSVALEMVLVLPILILVMGTAAQYHSFVQTRIFVEQAAYATAQSALANKCPPAAEISLGALLSSANCSDDPSTWENAARWALVPAAPSSGRGGFGTGCSAAEPGSRALRAAGAPGTLDQALRNRLCYVHGAGNVEIEVSWVPALPRAAGQPVYRAVRAKVRFKAVVAAPVGLLFSDGQHGDGLPWAWTEAEVILA